MPSTVDLLSHKLLYFKVHYLNRQNVILSSQFRFSGLYFTKIYVSQYINIAIILKAVFTEYDLALLLL